MSFFISLELLRNVLEPWCVQFVLQSPLTTAVVVASVLLVVVVVDDDDILAADH
jgi:hypothetical protein